MLISVVIRTRNEAAWIGRCLRAVFGQHGCELDVIVVDNESNDDTLSLVKSYPCSLINIPSVDFSYGRSLNLGLRAARSEFVAILSGHCIPITERWLYRLYQCLASSPHVAGVYGRQEPLADSSPQDKRDLWTTFGLDRKVQKKDWFFHNANSMVRKTVWGKFAFDEKIDGVEDREWARCVQERGFSIAYEPRASVFHHHGIHQGGDTVRAARVAKVIELIRDREVVK